MDLLGILCLMGDSPDADKCKLKLSLDLKLD